MGMGGNLIFSPTFYSFFSVPFPIAFLFCLSYAYIITGMGYDPYGMPLSGKTHN